MRSEILVVSENIDPQLDKPIDIGKKQLNKLPDDEKYQILTKHMVPEQNYVFSVSVTESGKKEKASNNTLGKYKWLIFSKEAKGYLCKSCATMNMGKKEF